MMDINIMNRKEISKKGYHKIELEFIIFFKNFI